MMIVEQMLNNAQTPLLHIADVSGSALFQGDCLEIMPLIPDKSVQLILADLPYGTTACKWDSIIDLDLLWKQYKRIIKDNGAIVLTASQPFTTDLINSNRDWFKYEMIWDKQQGSNMYEATKRPLKSHENILFFYKTQPLYNAQMTPALSKNMRDRVKNKFKGVEYGVYGKCNEYTPIKNENLRYPLSVYYHSSQANELHKTKRLHNTQKPKELMSFIIKSYSNENDMVLDNTMGSGTTCLAAKELNRKFIGIEKEANYYEIACRRCGF